MKQIRARRLGIPKQTAACIPWVAIGEGFEEPVRPVTVQKSRSRMRPGEPMEDFARVHSDPGQAGARRIGGIESNGGRRYALYYRAGGNI